jgi:DNA-binding response OmpR family regulator
MSNPASVLIIEDIAELADSLEDMLALQGFRALTALTGRDGYELAVTEHPDLILLDLRLPDLHGFELLRNLRADPWGANARVLVLTASESPDLVVSENLGVDRDEVLEKERWGLADIASRIQQELAR